MNNKRAFNLGACCLLAFMLMFTAAGCGDKIIFPEPPVKYTVSVENGTGGGEFKKDKTCTVTATVPEGKAFSKWTAGGEEVSRENPYTFTVSGNTQLTAVVGTPYLLTVDGGKINGTAEMEAQIVGGESVSIAAKSTAAKAFLYWQISGSGAKIYDNPYTFTLTADTAATAVFDEVCLISVDGGQVFLPGSPEGAARSMRIDMGGECTILSGDAPAGQKFAYWYYIDENKAQVKISEAAEYTFSVTASRKIYAKFEYYYVVTVVNGHINGDETLSAAEIWANASVTVTADIPAEKGFAYWEVNGAGVSTSSVYTFKVTENITVTAVFSDFIQLETPKNDTNQMFTKKTSGYSDMIVEFDRQKDGTGGRKTVFTEGADYVIFYLYTSTDAAKEDHVGMFKMLQTVQGGAAVIRTMDNALSISIGSTPGDYYFDRVKNDVFYALIAAAVGASYSPTQGYYVAAQVKAAASTIYQDSGISEIGTSVIKRS